MNDQAQAIRTACDAAVADPLLKPEYDEQGNVVKTKCNFAVQRIAHAAGYDGFADKTADEIIELMRSSPEWGKVDAERAAAAAAQGMLVVAGMEDQPHGHVTCVYPGGGLIYSGRWQGEAPVVANVGKENRIMGANYAFKTPPEFYAWTKKTSDPDA